MEKNLEQQRERMVGMLLRFGVSRGLPHVRRNMICTLQSVGGSPKHLEKLWRSAQDARAPDAMLATWLRDKTGLRELVAAMDEAEADPQKGTGPCGEERSRHDAFDAIVWNQRDPLQIAEQYAVSPERLLEVLIEYGGNRKDRMFADEVQRRWMQAMSQHHPEEEDEPT